MAHIDAGKTTTTERMLYYSGFSKHLGDVDHGDTVMDYMDLERERGITINSAAITFHWKKHKINLIDTPGHVDFTVEVERALRVLDGSVVVLDATAGVEAQTVTVWRQAQTHRLSSLLFLNKMDRPAACVDSCLQSVTRRLGATPLMLQLPLGTGRDFTGLVDLVTLTLHAWDAASSPDGTKFTSRPLTFEDGELYQRALAARSNLIGQLADVDKEMEDLVLGGVEVAEMTGTAVGAAVRRVTVGGRLVPVVVGSALKNTGVQPLMDAVVDFLPSPEDVPLHPAVTAYTPQLCAFAFKVDHHPQRGPLTFLRLYSGTLRAGAGMFNVSRQVGERATRVLAVYADTVIDLPHADEGSIVAVTGLKQTVTGDTLTSSSALAKSAAARWQKGKGIEAGEKKEEEGNEGEGEEESLPLLSGVRVPAPVFFCAVEPPSLALQAKLDTALACLTREDPSLRVSVDAETGQTVLSGLGELHLEVVVARLRGHYGVDVSVGPLTVAYRETVTQHAAATEVLDKVLGERQHFVELRMSVKPDSRHADFQGIELAEDGDDSLQVLRPRHLKLLENGAKSAFANGPLLGFPLTKVGVCLHAMKMRPGTSAAVVSACAQQCVSRALREAAPALLQPLMALQINTDESGLHSILADLSRRSGHVNLITKRNDVTVVEAVAPLAELFGYSSDLRIISSGRASLSMELSHYEKMTPAEENQVIENVTGLSPLK